MKSRILTIIFFLDITASKAAQGFEVLVKNNSSQTVPITLDTRIDTYFTHESKSTQSFIPTSNVIHFAPELAPGEQKPFFIPTTPAEHFLAQQGKNLTLHDHVPSHHVIRGTLIVGEHKDHYDIKENITKAQDLVLTVTNQGLSIETTEPAN